MKGWVKLHRKMWKNPRSKDPEWVAMWMYLLCQATHQSMDVVWAGKKMTLKPGQVISGQLKIAKSTGIHRSKVRRLLDALKSDHQIDHQTSNKSTLITITNWNEYQATDQQIDHQPTISRPSGDHQATTNKNNKNNKNEGEAPRPREGLPGLADLIRGARPEFEGLLSEQVVEAMLKTAAQSGMDVERNASDFAIDAGCMAECPKKPSAMLRNYLMFSRSGGDMRKESRAAADGDVPFWLAGLPKG